MNYPSRFVILSLWVRRKEGRNMFKEPMIRKGSCSKCGGPADELWYHTDWWHNKATDCKGGKFIANEEEENK